MTPFGYSCLVPQRYNYLICIYLMSLVRRCIYICNIAPRKISQTLASILLRISVVLVRELIFVPVSPRILSTWIQNQLPSHSSLIPLLVDMSSYFTLQLGEVFSSGNNILLLGSKNQDLYRQYHYQTQVNIRKFGHNEQR